MKANLVLAQHNNVFEGTDNFGRKLVVGSEPVKWVHPNDKEMCFYLHKMMVALVVCNSDGEKIDTIAAVNGKVFVDVG